MEALSASVVGGGFGGRLSLDALTSSPRFRLVAAADVSPKVRDELAAKYPGIRTFPDHRSMFRECPTDVVCVSTWPPSHEEVAMDALKLPLKGILVEKPLGHTHASGRRILEAIRARGLPMAVPHNLLSFGASLEVIRRVRAGDIGKLRSVEVECDKWDIMNAGIHWMNFFVMLVAGDQVESVMAACEASTRTFRDGMQVETTAITCVTTNGGVRAWMVTGDKVGISGGDRWQLFRIIGSTGIIEYQAWDNQYVIRDATHPSPVIVTPEGFPVTGHRRHLEGMADMIGGKADYSIPDSSISALAICEAAYLSARHKCKVVFPLEGFTPPPIPDWDPGTPYSGSGGGRDGRKL